MTILAARGGLSATALLALSLLLAGCPKSEDTNKAAPAASGAAATSGAHPAASTSAAAPAVPGASASAAGAGAKPTAQAAAYAGTYSLTPGAMYIPGTKDYASVKQAKDDPSKLVGEGNVSLAVDGEGKVTGTVDSGPAAPALVDGSVIDGEIRGVVRRKDPKDDGLTGTFLAKVAGDSVEGHLSLAEANAAIVREGKLSLKKK
jgi:hypothetical protein